jgi:hypothetical protein
VLLVVPLLLLLLLLVLVLLNNIWRILLLRGEPTEHLVVHPSAHLQQNADTSQGRIYTVLKRKKIEVYLQQNKKGRRPEGKKCHSKTIRGEKSRYN